MIVAHAPKSYFGSDIQKSLGSLPGFPWAKYPGEKHLPGHNYAGPETKKPNTTAWMNKAKPYFVDQIGDILQGDLDMNNFKVTNLKSPENDNDAAHKKYLREQINSIENIDDSGIQQQITTINNLVLKQDKNIDALEKRFLNKESYYFNLPFGNLSDASITDNTDKSKDYEFKKYGFTANIRVYSVPVSDISPQNIFDSDDENDYQPIFFNFDMLLETETQPLASIIRNPKPQKEIINYQFLRATDFEYVKLYFVDNDIFTSIDIHKSQQQQNFLIPIKRDDASVTMFLNISKPKFSVHLNKINDLKEQIFLVNMQFFSKVALSDIHLI
ncbi:hypothetical protein LOTGIDRAFT_171392 [Lottia gigantea]|uniref:Uncharacterized protein n=1 Tax=Lottia gigantea TaxID=225164 RepID=V4B0A9_LOTGI|nr:hypothetical protein LOTGIDRAFT_171392 [Lottia gigantea]ESP03453.1 hypothetical protein LOTGIDRAFT_171392 [Lottia gigantea]